MPKSSVKLLFAPLVVLMLSQGFARTITKASHEKTTSKGNQPKNMNVLNPRIFKRTIDNELDSANFEIPRHVDNREGNVRNENFSDDFETFADNEDINDDSLSGYESIHQNSGENGLENEKIIVNNSSKSGLDGKVFDSNLTRNNKGFAIKYNDNLTSTENKNYSSSNTTKENDFKGSIYDLSKIKLTVAQKHRDSEKNHKENGEDGSSSIESTIHRKSSYSNGLNDNKSNSGSENMDKDQIKKQNSDFVEDYGNDDDYANKDNENVSSNSNNRKNSTKSNYNEKKNNAKKNNAETDLDDGVDDYPNKKTKTSQTRDDDGSNLTNQIEIGSTIARKSSHKNAEKKEGLDNVSGQTPENAEDADFNSENAETPIISTVQKATKMNTGSENKNGNMDDTVDDKHVQFSAKLDNANKENSTQISKGLKSSDLSKVGGSEEEIFDAEVKAQNKQDEEEIRQPEIGHRKLQKIKFKDGKNSSNLKADLKDHGENEEEINQRELGRKKLRKLKLQDNSNSDSKGSGLSGLGESEDDLFRGEIKAQNKQDEDEIQPLELANRKLHKMKLHKNSTSVLKSSGLSGLGKSEEEIFKGEVKAQNRQDEEEIKQHKPGSKNLRKVKILDIKTNSKDAHLSGLGPLEEEDLFNNEIKAQNKQDEEEITSPELEHKNSKKINLHDNNSANSKGSHLLGTGLAEEDIFSGEITAQNKQDEEEINQPEPGRKKWRKLHDNNNSESTGSGHSGLGESEKDVLSDGIKAQNKQDEKEIKPLDLKHRKLQKIKLQDNGNTNSKDSHLSGLGPSEEDDFSAEIKAQNRQDEEEIKLLDPGKVQKIKLNDRNNSKSKADLADLEKLEEEVFSGEIKAQNRQDEEEVYQPVNVNRKFNRIKSKYNEIRNFSEIRTLRLGGSSKGVNITSASAFKNISNAGNKFADNKTSSSSGNRQSNRDSNAEDHEGNEKDNDKGDHENILNSNENISGEGPSSSPLLNSKSRKVHTAELINHELKGDLDEESASGESEKLSTTDKPPIPATSENIEKNFHQKDNENSGKEEQTTNETPNNLSNVDANSKQNAVGENRNDKEEESVTVKPTETSVTMPTDEDRHGEEVKTNKDTDSDSKSSEKDISGDEPDEEVHRTLEQSSGAASHDEDDDDKGGDDNSKDNGYDNSGDDDDEVEEKSTYFQNVTRTPIPKPTISTFTSGPNHDNNEDVVVDDDDEDDDDDSNYDNKHNNASPQPTTTTVPATTAETPETETPKRENKPATETATKPQPTTAKQEGTNALPPNRIKTTEQTDFRKNQSSNAAKTPTALLQEATSATSTSGSTDISSGQENEGNEEIQENSGNEKESSGDVVTTSTSSTTSETSSSATSSSTSSSSSTSAKTSSSSSSYTVNQKKKLKGKDNERSGSAEDSADQYEEEEEQTKDTSGPTTNTKTHSSTAGVLSTTTPTTTKEHQKEDTSTQWTALKTPLSTTETLSPTTSPTTRINQSVKDTDDIENAKKTEDYEKEELLGDNHDKKTSTNLPEQSVTSSTWPVGQSIDRDDENEDEIFSGENAVSSKPTQITFSTSKNITATTLSPQNTLSEKENKEKTESSDEEDEDEDEDEFFSGGSTAISISTHTTSSSSANIAATTTPFLQNQGSEKEIKGNTKSSDKKEEDEDENFSGNNRANSMPTQTTLLPTATPSLQTSKSEKENMESSKEQDEDDDENFSGEYVAISIPKKNTSSISTTNIATTTPSLQTTQLEQENEESNNEKDKDEDENFSGENVATRKPIQTTSSSQATNAASKENTEPSDKGDKDEDETFNGENTAVMKPTLPNNDKTVNSKTPSSGEDDNNEEENNDNDVTSVNSENELASTADFPSTTSSAVFSAVKTHTTLGTGTTSKEKEATNEDSSRDNSKEDSSVNKQVSTTAQTGAPTIRKAKAGDNINNENSGVEIEETDNEEQELNTTAHPSHHTLSTTTTLIQHKEDKDERENENTDDDDDENEESSTLTQSSSVPTKGTTAAESEQSSTEEDYDNNNNEKGDENQENNSLQQRPRPTVITTTDENKQDNNNDDDNEDSTWKKESSITQPSITPTISATTTKEPPGRGNDTTSKNQGIGEQFKNDIEDKNIGRKGSSMNQSTELVSEQSETKKDEERYTDNEGSPMNQTTDKESKNFGISKDEDRRKDKGKSMTSTANNNGESTSFIDYNKDKEQSLKPERKTDSGNEKFASKKEKNDLFSEIKALPKPTQSTIAPETKESKELSRVDSSHEVKANKNSRNEGLKEKAVHTTTEPTRSTIPQPTTTATDVTVESRVNENNENEEGSIEAEPLIATTPTRSTTSKLTQRVDESNENEEGSSEEESLASAKPTRSTISLITQRTPSVARSNKEEKEASSTANPAISKLRSKELSSFEVNGVNKTDRSEDQKSFPKQSNENMNIDNQDQDTNNGEEVKEDKDSEDITSSFSGETNEISGSQEEHTDEFDKSTLTLYQSKDTHPEISDKNTDNENQEQNINNRKEVREDKDKDSENSMSSFSGETNENRGSQDEQSGETEKNTSILHNDGSSIAHKDKNKQEQENNVRGSGGVSEESLSGLSSSSIESIASGSGETTTDKYTYANTEEIDTGSSVAENEGINPATKVKDKDTKPKSNKTKSTETFEKNHESTATSLQQNHKTNKVITAVKDENQLNKTKTIGSITIVKQDVDNNNTQSRLKLNEDSNLKQNNTDNGLLFQSSINVYKPVKNVTAQKAKESSQQAENKFTFNTIKTNKKPARKSSAKMQKVKNDSSYSEGKSMRLQQPLQKTQSTLPNSDVFDTSVLTKWQPQAFENKTSKSNDIQANGTISSNKPGIILLADPKFEAHLHKLKRLFGKYIPVSVIMKINDIKRNNNKFGKNIKITSQKVPGNDSAPGNQKHTPPKLIDKSLTSNVSVENWKEEITSNQTRAKNISGKANYNAVVKTPTDSINRKENTMNRGPKYNNSRNQASVKVISAGFPGNLTKQPTKDKPKIEVPKIGIFGNLSAITGNKDRPKDLPNTKQLPTPRKINIDIGNAHWTNKLASKSRNKDDKKKLPLPKTYEDKNNKGKLAKNIAGLNKTKESKNSDYISKNGKPNDKAPSKGGGISPLSYMGITGTPHKTQKRKKKKPSPKPLSNKGWRYPYTPTNYQPAPSGWTQYNYKKPEASKTKAKNQPQQQGVWNPHSTNYQPSPPGWTQYKYKKPKAPKSKPQQQQGAWNNPYMVPTSQVKAAQMMLNSTAQYSSSWFQKPKKPANQKTTSQYKQSPNYKPSSTGAEGQSTNYKQGSSNYNSYYNYYNNYKAPNQYGQGWSNPYMGYQQAKQPDKASTSKNSYSAGAYKAQQYYGNYYPRYYPFTGNNIEYVGYQQGKPPRLDEKPSEVSKSGEGSKPGEASKPSEQSPPPLPPAPLKPIYIPNQPQQPVMPRLSNPYMTMSAKPAIPITSQISPYMASAPKPAIPLTSQTSPYIAMPPYMVMSSQSSQGTSPQAPVQLTGVTSPMYQVNNYAQAGYPSYPMFIARPNARAQAQVQPLYNYGPQTSLPPSTKALSPSPSNPTYTYRDPSGRYVLYGSYQVSPNDNGIDCSSQDEPLPDECNTEMSEEDLTQSDSKPIVIKSASKEQEAVSEVPKNANTSIETLQSSQQSVIANTNSSEDHSGSAVTIKIEKEKEDSFEPTVESQTDEIDNEDAQNGADMLFKNAPAESVNSTVAQNPNQNDVTQATTDAQSKPLAQSLPVRPKNPFDIKNLMQLSEGNIDSVLNALDKLEHFYSSRRKNSLDNLSPASATTTVQEKNKKYDDSSALSVQNPTETPKKIEYYVNDDMFDPNGNTAAAHSENMQDDLSSYYDSQDTAPNYSRKETQNQNVVQAVPEKDGDNSAKVPQDDDLAENSDDHIFYEESKGSKSTEENTVNEPQSAQKVKNNEATTVYQEQNHNNAYDNQVTTQNSFEWYPAYELNTENNNENDQNTVNDNELSINHQKVVKNNESRMNDRQVSKTPFKTQKHAKENFFLQPHQNKITSTPYKNYLKNMKVKIINGLPDTSSKGESMEINVADFSDSLGRTPSSLKTQQKVPTPVTEDSTMPIPTIAYGIQPQPTEYHPGYETDLSSFKKNETVNKIDLKEILRKKLVMLKAKKTAKVASNLEKFFNKDRNDHDKALVDLQDSFDNPDKKGGLSYFGAAPLAKMLQGTDDGLESKIVSLTGKTRGKMWLFAKPTASSAAPFSDTHKPTEPPATPGPTYSHYKERTGLFGFVNKDTEKKCAAIGKTDFQDNCPRGWVAHVEFCYGIFEQPEKSWKAFPRKCAEHNAVLAMPKTEEQLGFLRSHLRDRGLHDKEFHIGLHRLRHKWRWIDDNEFNMDSNFNDLYGHTYHDINCGALYKGHVSSTKCGKAMPYICEIKRGMEAVRILAFGDSLTRGYYGGGKEHHPYTEKLQYLLNTDSHKCFLVDNQGKDKELAADMTKRLDKFLKKAPAWYKWIIILAGTNDIVHDEHPATEKNWDRIVHDIIMAHQTAHKYGFNTIVVTIPEIDCEQTNKPDCRKLHKERLYVNVRLRHYAMETSAAILSDLAWLLPRYALDTDKRMFFWESGLHMKPQGYDRMAEVIYKDIVRNLK